MPTSARGAAPAFTITALELEFDITARAIRFCEDVGLLTPGRTGRNRVYSQRDRTRLKLTLRGKRLGLSLQDIKQLVDMHDSPSDTTQQLTAFLAVLGEHRRLLEQQREDIDITLAEITQHEERCRKVVGAAGATAAAKTAAKSAAKTAAKSAAKTAAKTAANPRRANRTNRAPRAPRSQGDAA